MQTTNAKEDEMHKQLAVIVGLLAALSLFAQGGGEEGEEGEEGGWGPDIRLTESSSASYCTGSWSIAMNGDTVHVVFWDYRDGNAEIYYKRSIDGGVSWDPEKRLTTANGESVGPKIAVSGLYIYIVWRDDRDGSGNAEIYYKRSTDGGDNWGPDVNFSNTSAYSQCSCIAASGSNVHVVWEEVYVGIQYKRSTDNGSNWSTATNLANDGTYPSMAVSGGNIHVVWQNSSPEVYYISSSDNGYSWSTSRRLSDTPYESGEPSISVCNDNVHVVWSDYRDNKYEIYYKRSTDGGIDWDADTKLTNTTYGFHDPSIAVREDDIYLVWKHEMLGREIYYKNSSDNGENWDEQARIVNDYSTFSDNPSVAASNARTSVIWVDNRDGNSEIYYKHYLALDAGLFSIDSPYDTVWRGFSYTPKATVKNFESVEANFNVVCEVDSAGTVVYSDTAYVNGLSGDSTIQISFKDWIPAGTGQYAMSVSTLLDGDCDPSNDLMSKNVTSVLPPRDVAVLSLDSPQDTVCSEYTYIPRATFKNLFLEETASFQALCEFDTSGVLTYADTVAVSDLQGGQTRQVSFDSWTAGEENGILYNMSVKTVMPGDVDTTNDKLSKSILAVWPPRDVAAVAIITPPDFVWSGFAHIPRVWVKNLWEEDETFDVACAIDSLDSSIYTDTVQVTSLRGGDSLLLEFDPWSSGAVDTVSYSVTFITQLAKDLNRSNDTIGKEIHAVREVADIDIQDYAGNLSANTMFLTGARNAILVGSYVMVNPDNWQKNVDLYDGPANADLTLSYYCSDLVLFNGGKTIPAESVQVNVKQIATLALGEAALNIVQVPLFHTQAPNDPQHFVGTVTVTARSEGMVVSDEFTLEVKQVAGSAPLASSLCFGGEPLPEGNRLYWSRFGFGEQGCKLYRARLGSDEFAEISDNPPGTIECNDYDVEPQTGYKYKLGLEMPDGKEITIGPLSLTSSEDVGRIVLYETAPNPWAGVMEIRYFIPKTVSLAQLKIYDITGKLVKILVDGPQDAGEHSTTWFGTDERGRKVSSGVYFYVLETGSQKQTKKTVLIR